MSAIERHRAKKATWVAQPIGEVRHRLDDERGRIGAVEGGFDGATAVRADPLPPPARLGPFHPARQALRSDQHAEREPVVVHLPWLLLERARIFDRARE